MDGQFHKDICLTIEGPWPPRGPIPCMEPLKDLESSQLELVSF